MVTEKHIEHVFARREQVVKIYSVNYRLLYLCQGRVFAFYSQGPTVDTQMLMVYDLPIHSIGKCIKVILCFNCESKTYCNIRTRRTRFHSKRTGGENLFNKLNNIIFVCQGLGSLPHD